MYEKRNGIEISSCLVKVFGTLFMSHVTFWVIPEASSKWSFDDQFGSFGKSSKSEMTFCLNWLSYANVFLMSHVTRRVHDVSEH